MTTKKSNGQAMPKMEVKKTGTTATPVKTTESKKPSYEDLLKRLEELEKQQSKKPNNIEEMIHFFEAKKQKINQLAIFKNHKQNLIEAKQSTAEAIKKQDFEGQTFRLSFETNSKYSPEKLFNISNPEVVFDFAEFLIMKIEAKINLLEAEIKQDF